VVLSDSVAPSSTDARCGSSTLLFSPPVIPQLTAGVFFLTYVSVVVLLRSKDLLVIRPSSKDCFVI
jgi:hypothetical protein